MEKFLFPTKDQAELVLSMAKDVIDSYGSCKILDLKELSGCPPYYTDSKMGWESLEGFRVEQVREGWMITTTNPIPLEDVVLTAEIKDLNGDLTHDEHIRLECVKAIVASDISLGAFKIISQAKQLEAYIKTGAHQEENNDPSTFRVGLFPRDHEDSPSDEGN